MPKIEAESIEAATIKAKLMFADTADSADIPNAFYDVWNDNCIGMWAVTEESATGVDSGD
jgi:hypothetical protein